MFATHVYQYVLDNLKNYDGNYLEIGVYDGSAIAGIAKEYPNKTIYGIDPFIEEGHTYWLSRVGINQPLSQQREETYNNITNLDNVHLFEITSKNFHEQLTEAQTHRLNINMIFIDGDHHYEHVINDCDMAMTLLGDYSGCIIFDDTNLQDVKGAIYTFQKFYYDQINTVEYLEPNCTIFKVNGK
jgi:hypothetical protein